MTRVQQARELATGADPKVEDPQGPLGKGSENATHAQTRFGRGWGVDAVVALGDGVEETWR
jgi:hypothetical protein